jgi:hypothetical protein
MLKLNKEKIMIFLIRRREEIVKLLIKNFMYRNIYNNIYETLVYTPKIFRY